LIFFFVTTGFPSSSPLEFLLRHHWIFFFVATGLDPVVHSEPPHGLPDQGQA
jgi:hypothetical protein